MNPISGSASQETNPKQQLAEAGLGNKLRATGDLHLRRTGCGEARRGAPADTCLRHRRSLEPVALAKHHGSVTESDRLTEQQFQRTLLVAFKETLIAHVEGCGAEEQAPGCTVQVAERPATGTPLYTKGKALLGSEGAPIPGRASLNRQPWKTSCPVIAPPARGEPCWSYP